MKQRIAFLYLNTGAGHIVPAKALAAEVSNLFPDECETVLHNGFSDRMKGSRFFFEDGYRFTTNYFESAYVLFYRITAWPISIHFGNYLISVHGIHDLVRFFRDEGITKVVCLHEVLILITRAALNQVNPAIPLLTIVTDPFTAHNLWFYEKNTELVVFSQKLCDEAVTVHGFPREKIHVFPFMLSRKFDTRYTDAEKRLARERHGLPPESKVLLVAGGGEGLKRAYSLVERFISDQKSETMVVVCGKNRSLRRRIERLVSARNVSNVRVFGFVSFMCDLLNIADCVITKGGASTVMEVLSAGKPVIFSTYIRGQELGNVLFAVQAGVGWYLKKPRKILDRSYQILENTDLQNSIRIKIDNLNIQNGLEDLAGFIKDFSLVQNEVFRV